MGTTTKRDWLKEAYEIIHGKSKLKSPKREHLMAVAAQVTAFERSFELLENKMKEVYEKEKARRKDAGLPPPPAPPAFQRPMQ